MPSGELLVNRFVTPQNPFCTTFWANRRSKSNVRRLMPISLTRSAGWMLIVCRSSSKPHIQGNLAGGLQQFFSWVGHGLAEGSLELHCGY